MLKSVIAVIAYVLLAPVIGGLLAGWERKISARMQRRIGPPLLQPFYDVQKLFHKQTIAVDKAQGMFLISYFILMIFTGAMIFAGMDILMTFFVLSTASTFLYFASVVTSSPYSTLGGSRELIQMMAYEPAVLLTCVGFYLAADSFNVSRIISQKTSMILYLPGIFFAFVFILTIKMRKSPFDLSASHHPHQELVKGITTEMGAKNLALFEISEWYENVFLLSVVALFVINKNPLSWIAAVAVALFVWFLEILIDNSSARVKWPVMLMTTWVVTILAAGVNLLVLILIK
uniref:respiratory chain complex I subunit 1 family protein n=1 Tax=Eubacterium cellulosolvens TaxID=29322 RepID=UPI000483501D|nr:complex I subunit 1 family protein [[Eubacterium] cellulosolvens]